jgi:hypothetical protein
VELREREVGEDSLPIANPGMTLMSNTTDWWLNPGRKLRGETFLNVSLSNSHVAG